MNTENLDGILKEVSLIPELSKCLSRARGGLRFLKHAYVTTIYEPKMNALYNLQFLQKKKAIDDAHKARDWERFIFMHERPFRLDALLMLVVEQDRVGYDFGNTMINKYLLDVYTDAEGTAINVGVWRVLFERLANGKRNHDTLPADEWLTIYRGYDARHNDDGFSWTLDRATAEFFANRFSKDGKVKETVIAPADVMLHNNSRGESEIVYFGPAVD